MLANEQGDRLERIRRLRRLGTRRSVRTDRQLTVPVCSTNGATDSTMHSAAAPCRSSPAGPAAFSLPGAPCETPYGPAWVRTVRYELSSRPELAELLRIAPAAFAAVGGDQTPAGFEPSQAAFIDTETTGLTADVATYTFLIGIGRYELPTGHTQDADNSVRHGAFVVHQFFMRNPAEERAQLHLVAEVLGRCTALVSFNGRNFDLLLLKNRFTLARLPMPWLDLPHLDLLPPARRVWHARLGSCRLSNLEQQVLGLRRTTEDVPSHLIPEIYRQYYLSGVATEMLARVFYHNLMDITVLSLLAARLGQLFERGGLNERLAALHPLERLSLARCYVALDWPEAGITAYRAAAADLSAAGLRAEALRDLGFLLKRLARRAEAASVWEEWISAVEGDDVTPYVELAKYHEWHTADLATARAWAAWALHIAERWPAGATRAAVLADLRHRLARIERKLASNSSKVG